jgi:hypothetical protein
LPCSCLSSSTELSLGSARSLTNPLPPPSPPGDACGEDVARVGCAERVESPPDGPDGADDARVGLVAPLAGTAASDACSRLDCDAGMGLRCVCAPCDDDEDDEIGGGEGDDEEPGTAADGAR